MRKDNNRKPKLEPHIKQNRWHAKFLLDAPQRFCAHRAEDFPNLAQQNQGTVQGSTGCVRVRGEGEEKSQTQTFAFACKEALAGGFTYADDLGSPNNACPRVVLLKCNYFDMSV